MDELSYKGKTYVHVFDSRTFKYIEELTPTEIKIGTTLIDIFLNDPNLTPSMLEKKATERLTKSRFDDGSPLEIDDNTCPFYDKEKFEKTKGRGCKKDNRGIMGNLYVKVYCSNKGKGCTRLKDE